MHSQYSAGGFLPAPKVGDHHQPYRVTFVVDLFKNTEEERMSLGHQALHIMLEALMAIDCLYLLGHPECPGIYDGQVRYQVEPPGEEDWQDVPTCLKLGYGDCEDLACWRAAELRIRHKIPAKPIFLWRSLPDGGQMYHIQVMTPSGIEDPSRRLGMK